jgi:hypothetical protein
VSGLRNFIRKAAPVARRVLPILIALAAVALAALAPGSEQWPL